MEILLYALLAIVGVGAAGFALVPSLMGSSRADKRFKALQGDIQVNLQPKGERDQSSHAIALDIRSKLQGLAMPAGTAVKVVEPPPGPPVMGTLLAEIYGPDPETRRAVAAEVRRTFEEVPFIDSLIAARPR